MVGRRKEGEKVKGGRTDSPYNFDFKISLTSARPAAAAAAAWAVLILPVNFENLIRIN